MATRRQPQIGTTLHRALQLYLAHAKPLIGLALLAGGTAMLLDIVQQRLGALPPLVVTLVVHLIRWGVAGWCALTMYDVVQRALQQQRTSLQASTRTANGVYGRFVKYSAMLFGMLAVVVVAFALLAAFLMPSLLRSSGGSASVTTAATWILGALFGVGILYLFIKFGFYGIALIVDPQEADPLKRSDALVTTAFWKTVGFYVSTFALLWVPTLALFLLSRRLPAASLWLDITSRLVGVVVAPLLAVAMVIWYRELAERTS